MQFKSTPDSATILGYLAAGALWIALLGPAWAYIPATPTNPSANMNFADFVALNAAMPAGGLQDAFYSWNAWLFAALATALILLGRRRRTKSAGIVAVVLGLVQLVVSVLALKGEATVAMMVDNLPYLRIGSALFVIGIFLLIASGVVRLASSRTPGNAPFASPVPAQ
ncbi:hypothetical protein AB0H98_27855 [Nocardia salmonicida]|uniref:hypothetical protein n=1 Tax=Nocardia salmonicida TaxID=53431 RepID=UPI00340AEDB0